MYILDEKEQELKQAKNVSCTMEGQESPNTMELVEE
jgi:hypothetical protein